MRHTARLPAGLTLLAIATAGPALAAEPGVEGSAIGQAAGVLDTGGDQRLGAFAGFAAGGFGEVTTDSGMTFGLSATLGSGDYEKNLDRPGTNTVATLNEAYAYLVTGWGQIRIGDEDGAAKRATDLLPLLVGGQMDGLWADAGGAGPLLDHLGRTSDDATKVLYETPRLLGIRAGLSWAPDRKSLVEDITRSGDPVPAEEGFTELGLNWRGDRGPWSFELAAGYGWADAGRAGLDDTRNLTVAGMAIYAGFSVAALWFNGQVGTAAVPAGGADVDGWVLQGTYENGPFGATAWLQRQETEGLQDFSAHGVGLSWRTTRVLTLGFDLVKHNRSGPRGGPDGTVGQLTAEVRY